MNLAFDPWIPVVDRNQGLTQVSLCDAFQKAESLLDLAVRPDERIALMRLLIAVAQAALDGPADRADWIRSSERLAGAVTRYLKHWLRAFELFGDGPRFLQLPGLKPLKAGEHDEKAGALTSKLDLALASGHNDTLFDNAGGNPRTFQPHELALRLMTFQCFSPGGRIGVARWGDTDTPGGGSSNHAPCLQNSMVHAYIRGSSLLQTIHRNLLSKEFVERVYGPGRWGQPVWERMPASFEDTHAIRNATTTYLGRLVPLSRAILLDEDGIHVILGNGLAYPAFGSEGGFRDAAATVVMRNNKGKQEHGILSLNLDKALWRELHSLSVKRHTEQGVGGPLALENLDENSAFDLWAGGLAADQAKPLDLIESAFHLPAGMLLDTGQQVYQQGVGLAEKVEQALKQALEKYGQELSAREKRGPSINLASLRSSAQGFFWTAAEPAVPQLLKVAEQPAILSEKDWAGTEWGNHLRSSAILALQTVCPRSSARQLRAFVAADNLLRKTMAKELSANGGGHND